MSAPKTKKHIDIIIGIGAVLLVFFSIALLLHPFKKAETTPAVETPTETSAIPDKKNLKSIMDFYRNDSETFYNSIDAYFSDPDFDEIINIIKDDDIDLQARYSLIALIPDTLAFNEAEREIISEMCLDPQYESGIRMYMLLCMMPDSEESMDTINALLADDDVQLAAEAIRKWAGIDLAAAAAFVYPKVVNYTSEQGEILSISIGILCDAVREDIFNESKFIAACETILMDSNHQILDLKGTVTAYLSALDNIPVDVFRMILDADIDEYDKQNFIDGNFSTLQSICLNTTPSKEDTEIIIRCMESVPIPQVIDPLKDIAAGYGLDISHLTDLDI